MAMPFLNHTESSLNLQKFKKNPKNSNLNSFWACLLSIFIYISIFYVFNLSPSTLLSTTKFWFIISNTLILIIAADFGAFSSSKDHDFFDEYSKNMNATAKSGTIPSPEIVQYARIDEKTTSKYHEQLALDEEPEEKIINVVAADDHMTKIPETLDNKPAEIFSAREKDDDHEAEKPKEKLEKKNREVGNGGRKLKKRQVKILTAAAEPEEEGKMELKRTLSERYGEPRLEENEFSRMSDEELNRRVEEFIRRCNRQIRLESAASSGQRG